MILRRPTGCARRPRRGLSLLEVIIALAVLVLAIVAINRLVDIGTDRGNDARSYTRGTRLAQSKMAEVEAGLVSVSSETDGQFEGDDAAWAYKITPEPAGPPNLYTVTVRVTRNVQGRPLEIVLTQMVFDPTMMGSAAQAERPATEDPSATPTDMGMGTGTGTTPTTGTGTGGYAP
jgi:prepilin-type N-terminal cleavage/methylation domain-containing protein